eukprot:8981182-Heterocapsa_arctica.AAC.1
MDINVRLKALLVQWHRISHLRVVCRTFAYARKYDYQSWEAQQTELLADAMANHRVKEVWARARIIAGNRLGAHGRPLNTHAFQSPTCEQWQ